MNLRAAQKHLKALVKAKASMSVDPATFDAIAAVVGSWGAGFKKPGGSRRKGKTGEREFSRVFKALYPEAGRGIQSRDGGEVPDIDGTPFWVECKRLKSIGALRFMDQAQRDSDGRVPVVVMREDHGKPVAMVPLELLLGLLSDAGVDPDTGITDAAGIVVRGRIIMAKSKEAEDE